MSDLLDRAHAMSPDDLQAKRDELDDEAKQIGDAADAFEQLRHWMEGEMADLLSNPQFGPIAGARIKAMDKAATQPDATEQ